MLSVLKSVENIWYPERYHGSLERSGFFEGWYYKFENESGTAVFAVIIGISMNDEGSKEAFIQFVNGTRHTSSYYPFAPSAFQASEDTFKVRIGDSEFSQNHLRLRLPDITADIEFKNHLHWEKSLLSPNIMGPLSYWPYLECNHSIVSLSNTISGSISLKKEIVDLNKGKGYIEKDWGANFPKAHIWMQCNRFLNADAALSVAIAKMKLGGVPVVGFAAVLDIAEKRYVFSSYHLSNIDVQANRNHSRLVFTSAQHRLTINASPNQSVQLKAPNRIGMTSDIQESINASLSVHLTTRIGKNVFKDDGINAGLEVVGEW